MSALSSGDIKARAHGLGFELCGIAAAEAFPELGFLGTWLSRGYAGSMEYMARTADRRADVRKVMPETRSVIVLGTLYNTDRPYSTADRSSTRAHVARYAWGDDYHRVIERRLDALASWLRAQGPGVQARAYVDTGPVQERVYAARAGLGWIGKNTCLINPGQGSWFFLSELLVNVALEADGPTADRCGSCTRCLEACPTGALVEPYVLDARHCLSYLTIERRGDVPAEHRAHVGGRVFGCDICQEVCPWNRQAPASDDPAWQPRTEFDAPRRATLFQAGDEEWQAMLRGSALRRAGVTGVRRSLALALGASDAPEAREALVAVALGARPDDSPSFDDPLVTEQIGWALGQWCAREAEGEPPMAPDRPRLRRRNHDGRATGTDPHGDSDG